MRTQDELRTWYGWAQVSPPEPIEAGSLGRWQVTLHVGRYGIAAGGSLKLLFPTVADWPALQGRDPYEESFATVTTSSRAQLAWRFDPRGHREPWSRALIVDVARAPLIAGDSVLFYLGDPEGGSPGVRAQTVAQAGYEFRVVVDAFGDGRYIHVPSPTVDVVGGAPAKLAIVAPSHADPGEPLDLTVRLEDRWGNLARSYAGSIRLGGLPGLGPVALGQGDGGLKRVRITAPERPGIYRLQGSDERLGLVGESNPLQVRSPRERPYRALWGDLHGRSLEPHGADALAAYFTYARDVAALDFCSHQAADQRTTEAAWRELQEAVRRYNEPGRFAAFLGYRWAGNTAGGGVRNVLFLRNAAPLFRCRDLPEAGAGVVCFPLPQLHQALRVHEALLIAGMGSPQVDLEYHDPELDALVELYTAWGESPWLLEDALQRGLRVGFVANGAGGQGKPGGTAAGAGDLVGRGGLTCVQAGARTREAIWEALHSRRCYGTTGARILLDVQAEGHSMGEVIRTSRPLRLTVRVAGTAEVERVDIHRGREVAYRYPERPTPRPGWLRVVWGGALARDWPRQAPWDGTLRMRDARILEALAYSFDSPARGIFLSDERSVSWRSTTAGNENGVLIHLDAGREAQLEFHSPLTTFTVGLSDLPREERLGGEGLHVQVERWPQSTGSKDLELDWADSSLLPGTTPYYVTVHQTDGAKAWSSPIYLVQV